MVTSAPAVPTPVRDKLAEILSAEALTAALSDLPGWEPGDNGGSLKRTFVFRDFNAAFGFMARVALAAEKADHHPDWRNVYRTVEVTLSTHDAGGVTNKDIALAKAMNAIATSA